MAGTVAVDISRGYIDNTLNPAREFVLDFVAGADGSFPVGSIPDNVSGILTDVGIIWGSTGPNTLNISIADGHGRVIYAATGLTATQVAGLLLSSIQFGKGLTVTLSNNATNSAAVKIILYVM